MSPRLLMIGEADAVIGQQVDALRQTAPRLVHEQLPWSGACASRLRATEADLILVTATSPEGTAWLSTMGPTQFGAPMLVVLNEVADAGLIRHAAEMADDFVIAPMRGGELQHRILRLLNRAFPYDTNETAADGSQGIKERLARQIALSGLIGRDPAFLRTLEKIPRAARAGRGPVLVVGETGTGKELCARAIHNVGARSNFPFIIADCATLPDHLFENEVFGHVSGAFTDARRDQKGLVALAVGGTLFLDEVDSLSLIAQAKLLRLLQERTYRPLGSSQSVTADLNIIAATNGDLETLVRAKQFRADLYFRLNVLRLDMVPLRQRRSDIPLLARHFLTTICAESGLGRKTLSQGSLLKLNEHDWPGNVRELHNVIERAVIFSDGPVILPADIAGSFRQEGDDAANTSFRDARLNAIATFERRYVEDLMRACRGNVSRAARLAVKDRRAFGRLVKRYEVSRDDP